MVLRRMVYGLALYQKGGTQGLSACVGCNRAVNNPSEIQPWSCGPEGLEYLTQGEDFIVKIKYVILWKTHMALICSH